MGAGYAAGRAPGVSCLVAGRGLNRGGRGGRGEGDAWDAIGRVRPVRRGSKEDLAESEGAKRGGLTSSRGSLHAKGAGLTLSRGSPHAAKGGLTLSHGLPHPHTPGLLGTEPHAGAAGAGLNTNRGVPHVAEGIFTSKHGSLNCLGLSRHPRRARNEACVSGWLSSFAQEGGKVRKCPDFLRSCVRKIRFVSPSGQARNEACLSGEMTPREYQGNSPKIARRFSAGNRMGKGKQSPGGTEEPFSRP